MAVFHFEEVTALQNLWISPVAVISQVGILPYLIFEFIWSGINEATKHLAPVEAMRFRGAIQRILRQVLTTNSQLGPVYLGKVDLADAYMRFWVRMEDVLSIAFLILNKNPSKQQLVGFHLSFPMGYVDSAPYFCMATETLSDLSNKSITHQDVASAHPLEQAVEARAADDMVAPESQADASWVKLPK